MQRDMKANFFFPVRKRRVVIANDIYFKEEDTAEATSRNVKAPRPGKLLATRQRALGARLGK